MATDAALALPPAAAPARPRVLLVGTALTAAGVVMAFTGLIGLYLAERASALADGGTWLPEGATIPLTPGNMAMATLLISAVTMWWAVDAVGKNDRQGAYLALGLTMMFGLAVINAISFLYTQMGLTVSTVAGLLIFTITGAYIAFLVGAMAYAAVMTFRTLGGEYSGRDREGLIAAALFWYANIAVFAVIWFAIFVTK
ncbi:MAG: cytochrome c oxidase subunit 3 [Acidimicrobiales bacterium]|nr:cytochrome c oxidase subunit 3 [Acidimicrobiales bacterium]